jgi:hypothetical protein
MVINYGRNGLSYPFGIVLGANGHDGVWHLSLAKVWLQEV